MPPAILFIQHLLKPNPATYRSPNIVEEIEIMAALIDAIDIKRKMSFEYENVPFYCLESDISTPTARGGQTLVRLRMRNMLTRAVFDKTFKASDKFKEPDLQTVDATYLYSDGDGSYFLDQESFETLSLSKELGQDALDRLIEGTLIKLDKYNGNPISLELPGQVELAVIYTEPGARGGDSSGRGTKPSNLATGIESKVPSFFPEGDTVRLPNQTRQLPLLARAPCADSLR